MNVSSSKEPIRLFKSDVLEFFTHIHPIVILVIWIPVMLFLLIRSIVQIGDYSMVHIPVGFAAGIVLWTLTEYVLHRFVFHFKPRTPWQERISFLFHGIHHAQPMSKTRLVMPPVVSIPLAAIVYGLYVLIVQFVLGAPHWVGPLLSGLVAGYLVYDILHYSMHHFTMRGGFLKYIRKYHMLHHGKTPDRRFGVSSPIWDFVFRTLPKD